MMKIKLKIKPKQEQLGDEYGVRVGDRVIAHYPDADLVLTVTGMNHATYFFHETNSAMWWFKSGCTKIK